MDPIRRPPIHYVVLAVMLGIVSLLLAIAKISAGVLVVDILAAATALVGGYAARGQGVRPVWIGAAVGGVYGAVEAAASFDRRVTVSQLRTALRGRSTGGISLQDLAKAANSPAAHMATIVEALLLFAVVGLVLGAIGGAFAGSRDRQRRGV